MSGLALAAAILAEVTAALSLRAATHGKPRLYAVVAVGYAASFVLLAAALRLGMGIGVAYGIWTAVGVTLTALASRWLFKEPLTWVMGAGIVLVAAGVFLVELGGH